jgi:hypothetical protein
MSAYVDFIRRLIVKTTDDSLKWCKVRDEYTTRDNRGVSYSLDIRKGAITIVDIDGVTRRLRVTHKGTLDRLTSEVSKNTDRVTIDVFEHLLT